MCNFKIGEKVVSLVAKKGWFIEKAKPLMIRIKMLFGKVHAYGPDYNEIVTIVGFDKDGFLSLKEYHKYGCYNPNCFRKLDYQFAEEILSNIKEQVKSEELCHT